VGAVSFCGLLVSVAKSGYSGYKDHLGQRIQIEDFGL
jgi:hypothetical protein